MRRRGSIAMIVPAVAVPVTAVKPMRDARTGAVADAAADNRADWSSDQTARNGAEHAVGDALLRLRHGRDGERRYASNGQRCHELHSRDFLRYSKLDGNGPTPRQFRTSPAIRKAEQDCA